MVVETTRVVIRKIQYKRGRLAYLSIFSPLSVGVITTHRRPAAGILSLYVDRIDGAEFFNSCLPMDESGLYCSLRHATWRNIDVFIWVQLTLDSVWQRRPLLHCPLPDLKTS